MRFATRALAAAAATLTLIPAIPASAATTSTTIRGGIEIEQPPGFDDPTRKSIGVPRDPRKPAEDWMTEKQCKEDWLKVPARHRWVRNHFSACQVWVVTFYVEVCTNNKCKRTGEAEGVLYSIGRNFNTARRETEWTISVRDLVHKWGDPTDAVVVRFDFPCEVLGQAKGTCGPAAEIGNQATVAQWRAGHQATIRMAMTTTRPAPGDRDNKLLVQTALRGQVIGSREGPVTWPVMTTRCDNANYSGGGGKENGGCIFTQVFAVLHYQYGQATSKDSVHFFWQAMNRLSEVKPGSDGLHVPGKWDSDTAKRAEPLTRNVYGNTSRNKVRRECVRLFGPDYTKPDENGRPTRACDEYPFASTYQNANYDSTGSALTWAVKALSFSHNSSTGGTLGNWYRDDHILDGDEFWVNIEGGPAPRK